MCGKSKKAISMQHCWAVHASDHLVKRWWQTATSVTATSHFE